MSSVLDDLIQAELQAKGQSGEVTAAAVATAIGQMTSSQKSQARKDLGAEPVPTTVTVSGTTPTIEPQANTIYKCSELTSLTISNPPATGKFWIWFTSGATPTTTVGIANFAAEADKKYRITVEDGYATYDAWSVGGD